ncbi:hypothetical protein [Dyadobacter luticola]|uniref:Uncharacterized protein n=1 Tax=Dyadobacter luticola TaxID=1979387 RepID=A0A5R9KTY7_9BACT|nr:hypothetical protein [Dyadobacter luticola]TLU99574.1 hypothetical protein FEN17_23765 [Dyadobacter luticola]
MEEREPTDLEKEAENYFDRNISLQRGNGFGYDHYKFIGTSKSSVDTAVLRKFKSKATRTYPLKQLLDFYKEQDLKVQKLRDKAKE